MRHRTWLIGLTLLASSGCSSMNHTERGALTGGVLGGAAGTVLGGLACRPGVGAAIGAGTGAVLGGLIGNEEDRADKRAQDRAAAWAARQMSVDNVVEMAQSRVSDDIIVNQINTTGSVFQLSSQDVIYLRQQGVSERVIGAMQAARGPVLIGGRYVRPAGSVVIVEPPPPPPVHVGFGVGFGHHHFHHHRGCW